VFRSFRTVALDFALHLIVLPALGGGNKCDPLMRRGELQRIAALTAADTAQDQSHISI
jgi:hypothetical protein